jgi:hypothetical protein
MGEGRDNRFSFRMADDERRVLAAQSLDCDQHPYALKQFGCQSKPETSTQAIWAPSPEAAGKSPRAGVIPTFAAN